MHQTRKGNQWYFGMKAHIGADRDSKLVHTVVVTAANVADITKTAELLHGQETQVHADAGYTGVEKREDITALNRTIDGQIARKRGQLKSWGKARRRNCSRRWSKPRPPSVPSWSIPFTSSRTCFGTERCATGGWRKTAINSTPSSDWPI